MIIGWSLTKFLYFTHGLEIQDDPPHPTQVSETFWRETFFSLEPPNQFGSYKETLLEYYLDGPLQKLLIVN
jgi:hypothetical protein